MPATTETCATFNDTYEATVEPGKFIAVRRVKSNSKVPVPSEPRTFKVGDHAVHGSFNLVYTGEIVSIGPKTVSIREWAGDTRTKRLKLTEFCWRNWDYDQADIARRNHETMLCI